MRTDPLALAALLSAFVLTPAFASQPTSQPAPAFSSTPAPAPEAVPGTQPATQAAPQERLICRRQSSGGSRTPRQKVCLTKSEWRAQDEASGLNDMRERSDGRR